MPIKPELLRTTMLTGIAGISLSANSAGAGDLLKSAPPPLMISAPAVDGPNATIEGFGGTLANKAVAGSKGALTVPLGGQFGAQVDGAWGIFDRRSFRAAAGHLFWRDPAIGLLGVYGSHTWWSRFGGVRLSQIGGETEYYWQRFTLQAVAGVEFGNSGRSIRAITFAGFPVQSFNIDTRFFDRVNLAYYLTDDWKAYVGHRYLGGRHALALSSEFGLPLGRGVMAAAYVEGRISGGDHNGVWGGLRVYFGQNDKPLIDRNRMDDPISWSPDTLFSIVNSTNQSFIPRRPDTVLTGSGGGSGGE